MVRWEHDLCQMKRTVFAALFGHNLEHQIVGSALLLLESIACLHCRANSQHLVGSTNGYYMGRETAKSLCFRKATYIRGEGRRSESEHLVI